MEKRYHVYTQKGCVYHMKKFVAVATAVLVLSWAGSALAYDHWHGEYRDHQRENIHHAGESYHH